MCKKAEEREEQAFFKENMKWKGGVKTFMYKFIVTYLNYPFINGMN